MPYAISEAYESTTVDEDLLFEGSNFQQKSILLTNKFFLCFEKGGSS